MTSVVPLVGVIMGSQSDWPKMKPCTEILDELEIAYETKVVSAHRTPKWMMTYAECAASRGLKVIIAGAGGAAHLPGMTAAFTLLPVIGVPIQSSFQDGLDSLLSIAQMPKGTPVATMGANSGGSANAALMAGRILALSDSDVAQRLTTWQSLERENVLDNPDPAAAYFAAQAAKGDL